MLIETQRLRMREFRLSDVDDAFLYLSDTAVMQFVEYPFDRQRTKEFIRECGIEQRLVYALIEKATEKVIGHAIFHPFRNEKVYEIGCILRHESWHKGYAFEISQAIIQYAFDVLNVEKTVAEAAPGNHASLSLIKKLGMTQEADDMGLLFFSKSKDRELRA